MPSRQGRPSGGGQPEPTVESTQAGEPLPAETAARRGRHRAHRDDAADVDLDARDRRTSPRRKQSGPARPGPGAGEPAEPADAVEQEPPDVPPSDPVR